MPTRANATALAANPRMQLLLLICRFLSCCPKATPLKARRVPMRGGLGAASKQREGECVFSRTRAALAVPFTMKGGAVHCGPARQGEGASDQHTPRGAG